MAKHRDTVFNVVRTSYTGAHTTIGTYRTLRGADEAMASAEQEMLDRGMNPLDPDFTFRIETSTYYDE